MAKAPAEETFEIDLAPLLAVLMRRKWIIICVTLAFGIGAAIRVSAIRPRYTAMALLLIEKEAGGARGDTIVSESKAEDYYQTQYRLLRSKSLLKQVHETLELGRTREFAGGAGALEGAVDISPVPRSRLVNVCATSFEPALAASIANKLAELYMAQNLENKLFISKDILSTLQAKIGDGADVEERYQSLPAVVNNPLIQQLKANYAQLQAKLGEVSHRYTEQHPERIRLNSEMQALRSLIRQETVRAVQGLKAELSGQLLGNNVRIVDQAEAPAAPSYPNKRKIVTFACVVGLGLGVALALVLDHLDQAIRSQDDIEKTLALPLLGAVTKSPKFEGATAKEYFDLLGGVDSFTGESFKNIRTMIDFAVANKGTRKYLITSTIQGEGKTFMAINLAMTFTQLGRKVLLIDGDMRKPNIHKRFALPKDRGLSHFLAHGKDPAELEGYVLDSGYPGLKVMVCGTTPPNPAELLNTPRVHILLEWALANYDQVIVDGTPIFPISDALLWSRELDAAVYVVKYGAVHPKLAAKAVEKLREAGIFITGAVVNQVTAKPGGYGYGDYYYRYSYYYSYGEKDKGKEKKSA